jgi:hypothetical protein
MPKIALPPAKALDLIVVTLSCILFLLLTTHQITAPGFYYDEALDAVPAMQIVQGQPTDLLNNASLDLFGRHWPLMLLDYQGIISTYLLVPFFLLGGINVVAVRAFPIVAGVIAILLTYVLGRLWFDRGTGRIAALLLAVSPSWVFWSRIGATGAPGGSRRSCWRCRPRGSSGAASGSMSSPRSCRSRWGR